MQALHAPVCTYSGLALAPPFVHAQHAKLRRSEQQPKSILYLCRPWFKTSARSVAKPWPTPFQALLQDVRPHSSETLPTNHLTLQAKFFEFSKFIVGMLLEVPQLLHSLMETPIEDTHTALCLPPGDKMYNALLVSCLQYCTALVLADAKRSTPPCVAMVPKAC